MRLEKDLCFQERNLLPKNLSSNIYEQGSKCRDTVQSSQALLSKIVLGVIVTTVQNIERWNSILRGTLD